MLRRLAVFWDMPPAKALSLLTVIALVPRLVAVFFSPGYFAHDDHFLIIEAAASWVDGHDYNSWLPWNQGEHPIPTGHSFFYVGLHYLLFSALKAIGVTDPKSMMFVVRLLHAIWSLVVVRVGYRIALRLSEPVIAWRTGLFLALFCYMPFLSVRNQVEMACIPFLMLGAWQLVKREDGPSLKDVLFAGIWIGLAINIRFQTIFFAAGPSLALLLRRPFWYSFVHGLGLLIPIAAIQGIIDGILWDRPLAELTQYVMFNLGHTTDYGVLPWYNYLLLLTGLFIPPLSIAVLFGFFRRTSPLLLWLPVLLFLVIHSYFPNKQERFMLPIVPLFFVLGFVSWEQWRMRSHWWIARARLWNGALVFVWCLNLLILPVLCTAYSKRSRVEALYALRSQGALKGLVIEDSVESDPFMPPLFYWGKWDASIIYSTDDGTALRTRLADYAPAYRPDVVLFLGKEDLEARWKRIEQVMGPLTLISETTPGLVDRVLHRLNPVNRNETIVIARATTQP